MLHEFTRQDPGAQVPGKECPRCHATFLCDVREGCWCETVHLDKETLQTLRSQYVDCLCPTCLKEFESHKN